ncbi:MAG: hypothetical protein P4M11_14795 [Candidatus Pacebacteria bacterium]|nr:hypothetical protein [Candidatus Paceibacterota bacterium]
MGATLICYLIIIPRILSVVKQKSQVMQIFADISDDYIKEMLSSIGQISIQEVAYGKEMTFVRKPFKEAMSPGACGNANETLEKPDKDSVAVRDKLGPSDVTKQTDEALALTTQNNQVNAAAESKAQAARAKIQRKRESLKKSGYLCRVPSGRSEIKRKSIITISAIVIVIWMFFAGSIGITELIYKYYNDITKAWKSVGMRRPYLSLQVNNRAEPRSRC